MYKKIGAYSLILIHFAACLGSDSDQSTTHPFVSRYSAMQDDPRYQRRSILEVAAMNDDFEALRHFIKIGYNGKNLILVKEILETNNELSRTMINHLNHKKKRQKRRIFKNKKAPLKQQIEQLEQDIEQRNRIIALINERKT